MDVKVYYHQVTSIQRGSAADYLAPVSVPVFRVFVQGDGYPGGTIQHHALAHAQRLATEGAMDRQAHKFEPRIAKLGLKAEAERHRLCRPPKVITRTVVKATAIWPQ